MNPQENQNLQAQAEAQPPTAPNTPVVTSVDGSNPVPVPPPTPPPTDSLQPDQTEHFGNGWKIVFVILGVLWSITITIPILFLLYLALQAQSGVSGTEFVALLILPLQVAGIPVALVTLVAILIHLFRRSSSRAWKMIAVTWGLLSLAYVAVGVIGVASIYSLGEGRRAEERKYASYVSEISVEQGKQMLAECQISELRHGYDASFVRGKGGNPEDSSSGVLLFKQNGVEPRRLTVAERHRITFNEIYKEAKKRCPNSLERSG